MELLDRRENLRLMARLLRGFGDTDLEEYEPPSVALARDLREPPEDEDEPVARGDLREIQVRDFLSKVGE